MTNNLLEKLADSVPSWGAKVAYGDTTSVNGHDVLPVAVVVFGFGAGEGSGETPDPADGVPKKGEGSGGGGGGYAIPIGAYIGDSSGVAFRPNPVALLAVAIPLISAAGWAFSRIIRAAN